MRTVFSVAGASAHGGGPRTKSRLPHRRALPQRFANALLVRDVSPKKTVN